MVDVNLLPERCENSDVVTIDILHDGIKRSFRRVKSTPRRERMRRRIESIEIDPSQNNGFGYWYGEDDLDGSTFNYVQDEDGNVHGSFINMSNHSVMQFSMENGNSTVIITDSSSFGDEIPIKEGRKLSRTDTESLDDIAAIETDFFDETQQRELSTSDIESDLNGHQSAKSYLRISNDPALEQEEQVESRYLYDDNGGNLDIMVVWTIKAECKNYNLPDNCTPNAETAKAMMALINLAIDETNTAYELSGVRTQLYLAHAYRHPTFVETSMTRSLGALRRGEISGTEENRKRYGADMVAMILNDDVFCGSGYFGPRIDRMYSVTSWKCTTGYFSFGHEVGHNLGLRHDRGSSYYCYPKRYNFGYRDPQARFRTILAYDCRAGQCDNNPGGGCTRIQRFSSATGTFEGMPVGDWRNDSARWINKVASTVALYFPHGGTVGNVGTKQPSQLPTSTPSQFPTTITPSIAPSDSPSRLPSRATVIPLPIFPSQFPSSSPLSKPSQTPTSKPSDAPSESCKDSPLEFYFLDQLMDCGTTTAQPNLNLCSHVELKAVCPKSCQSCDEIVLFDADPSLTFVFYHTKKEQLVAKGCDNIAKNPTVRCSFPGISETCRATCGLLNNNNS